MIKKTIKCLLSKVLTKYGLIGRYDARHRSVLILMYHRVNKNPDCLGLTVTPELFSHQLGYLMEHYEVISLGQAVSLLSAGVVTGNYCVITFDDGYRDNYQVAAPILTTHNIPATIFVTYDAIQNGHFGWSAFDRAVLTTKDLLLDLQPFELGQYSLIDQSARELTVLALHRLLKLKPDAEKHAIVEHVVTEYGDGSPGERNMMNWEEVSELADNDMVTIGAHSITHPILSRVSLAQARQEVIEGKYLIERQLGKSVDFFAYPNGQSADIGQEVVSLVKEAGYIGACTTIAGRNRAGVDPLYLRRVDVTTEISTDCYGRFSPELFATMTSGIFYRK